MYAGGVINSEKAPIYLVENNSPVLVEGLGGEVKRVADLESNSVKRIRELM